MNVVMTSNAVVSNLKKIKLKCVFSVYIIRTSVLWLGEELNKC